MKEAATAVALLITTLIVMRMVWNEGGQSRLFKAVLYGVVFVGFILFAISKQTFTQ
jgi:hypothetical protein